jgi:hypothetical protein
MNNSKPTSISYAIANRQTVTDFKTHYINIPAELQWQMIKRKSGSFNLSAGIQNLISINKKDAANIPDFVLPSGATFRTPPVIALYQPLLQLTPSYEWQRKNHSFSLGAYVNYGLLKVYSYNNKYHWRQAGLTFRYFFPAK